MTIRALSCAVNPGRAVPSACPRRLDPVQCNAGKSVEVTLLLGRSAIPAQVVFWVAVIMYNNLYFFGHAIYFLLYYIKQKYFFIELTKHDG